MWEFRSFYNGIIHRWWWRLFVNGHLEQESRPDFRSVNDAISDARMYGFQMHLDRWEIRTSGR